MAGIGWFVRGERRGERERGGQEGSVWAVDLFMFCFVNNGCDQQVWSLETFELLTDIVAHKGAVLGLFISAQGNLLFSSAGDAIVNVCTISLFGQHLTIPGCLVLRGGRVF